jgi:hypothetical protein
MLGRMRRPSARGCREEGTHLRRAVEEDVEPHRVVRRTRHPRVGLLRSTRVDGVFWYT